MIWSLIVGGLLGWFASLITGRDVPGGVIGNIIAGIIGSGLVRNYLVVSSCNRRICNHSCFNWCGYFDFHCEFLLRAMRK